MKYALKKSKLKKRWLPFIAGFIGGLLGILVGLRSPSPVKKDISIKARQYAYEPAKLEANMGDTLIISLASLDVVHGFYLEGYDTDAEIYPGKKKIKVRKPSEGNEWEDADLITIVANKPGKFRYRCSHTCGTMHPFMQGELIVSPNIPYHAGIGVFIGFFCGLFIMLAKPSKISKFRQS
jgi:heme/copper-type cytochrome/quinol oxidase subunit 2